MVSPNGLKRSANHLAGPAVDSKKSKSNGSITSFFVAPKAKPGESKPATTSSSFNKEKWVASLTPEQKELLQLEIDTLDESWLAQLRDEVVTPEFLSLKRFLSKEKQSGAKIFPPENEIYSWCDSCT
jgi:uracil-DNA glycosylase